MTKKIPHVSKRLRDIKPVVYTAQSARNFHQRMLICKFVFDKGGVPLNPFNIFGYYLYELVDRNTVRNGNNNVMTKCDEMWVFGEISDGVQAEIEMFKELKRPIRYFDISLLPNAVTEIKENAVVLEKQ